MDQRNRDCR